LSPAIIRMNQTFRSSLRSCRRLLAVAGTFGLATAILPLDARQAPAGCQITGKASSATRPLPGVSLVARAGDTVKAVTSTEPDGTYRMPLAPGTYTITAELTGFTTREQSVTMDMSACATTVDFTLALAPRVVRPEGAAPAPRPAVAPQRGATTAGARFEALAVEQQATAAAGFEMNPPERDPAAALLLPPGFSTEGPTQALAVTGNMASIDRGLMADRMDAIGRGEFDPATGEFRPGFEAVEGGQGGGFGMGGRGGGRGGPGGDAGGFMMGGRGRGQNAYNIQANYSLAGSALESAPYQLRPDSPARQQPYTRQNFGTTVGGPFRIPGLYNGQRRTTFTLTYGGARGGNLFDQYATVPTKALRAGDFSSSIAPITDPLTGQPFEGNRIPQSRMSPAALALLRFMPAPNLPGDARNFHYTTTTDSVSDNVNLRFMHMLTQPPQGGRGGPGGGRGGGFGGRMGGRGGPGQQQALTITMTAQLQYRRNHTEQINVFPTLGGQSRGSTFGLPLSLNIMHRRTMHTLNVNLSRTTSDSVNQYAFVEDVAGGAGITGVSTDPFAWGVPQLSFSGLSAVRDLTPSKRRDRRVSFAYGWTRPFTRHTLRLGGDVRLDRSHNQTDTNARGAFVFTGLHASGGGPVARGTHLDFADFLLGLPQQATVQYGPGNVRMTGRSMSLYLQDDWRRTSTLTFNLGVRYELLLPFVESGGRMVNLDAAPGFTAVAPVVSGGTGPFSGAYPTALIHADTNNVAPRVGFAWRARPGTVVRGGYGISYNSGAYSTIARQLVGQPPFAVTNAAFGTLDRPLSLATPFASASPTETTNNFGVDRDYALGVVQTWNGDVSRDLRQVWNVGASYTHTRGSSLDILRAPNRDPDGLRIEGVHPFLWQTSEGSSVLHAGTFRVRRRPVRGIGAGATYTLARSRDNASSLGGGGGTVAQDDRNLAAEWGLSSFDRRHQVSAETAIELPFGPNRPWLSGGGRWAALLRDWRFTTTFTWQSGTPNTARVQGAVADVARGTNGSLRAHYTGEPIRISGPSADRFFNTAAFTVPEPGAFGTSSRNMIVGPGSRLLNAQFSRDVRLGGNRALTLQVNTSNLLNTVNYGAIDTTVNAPTFGQVLSVRGMRASTVNLRFRF
jgi:trimeric autotransporter adhesin